MDKIEYTRGTYSKEAQKVVLEVREDLDIHEFKVMCKRLAASLGYSPASVEEAFGSKPPLSGTDKMKKILKG
tara:strand:+ start:742 stop:957 length:216 start_codon:yes stop_codon:yes gene_type:complete